ncbi:MULTISPECIES: NnrS family protein [unclassified Ruegeria]|uniref:NnrS family protein n=1 Tax=unclassified Ruegeria TaxID=2625375 RepID=UPI001ADA8E29|nr:MULTISPECIES: NnrS family protein [unclassified Ruegeria]MBO9411686.1 NnrS family protein [Ruegeria sp. R8_1]MBO9415752.1 NnrS family protein [Ruegeria sp. R8_2]
MPAIITRVFGEGFRVFFLSAGLYGLFVGLVWGLWLSVPYLAPDYAMTPPMWHAHEMIFGYATAALGGFFLTAVPNWTGAPDARARFITLAAGLWLAGRMAMWFSGQLSPVLVAVVDLAFVPILAAKIATQLVRRPKPQNMIFLLLLVLIWVSDLLTHLEWIGLTGDTLGLGLRAGLLTLCAMIAILGGRITPAFTRNAMKRAGLSEGDWPVSVPALDKAGMGLALALPLSALVFGIGPVPAVVAVLLGAVQVLRMARWRTRWTLRQPILLALHLGLGMLALGLILWGLAELGLGNEVAALHVLGIGCVGGMTLAVMSRAALGHSGRELVAPGPMVVAYGLMAVAALTRWVGTDLNAGYVVAMLLSDGLWVAAFALYLLAMWPALTGPRAPRSA